MTNCNEKHVRRRIVPGALVAAVLLCALCAGWPAAPVAAQNSFISNLFQGHDRNEVTATRAQSFTTGSDSGGYTLIDISMTTGVPGVGAWTVAVHADAGGSPGSAPLHILRSPRRVDRNSTNVFTASAGAALEPDTTYHVVVDLPDIGAPVVFSTTSSGVDGTAHPGWSFPRGIQTLGGSGWGTASETHRLQVDIRGVVSRVASVTVSGTGRVNESDRLDFLVTLEPASADTPVPVRYMLGGTTTAGSDYLGAARGTLTFNPGENSKFITLGVIDDNLDEVDETVVVTLLASSDGSVRVSPTAGSATAVILDNDRAPQVCLRREPQDHLSPMFPQRTRALSMAEGGAGGRSPHADIPVLLDRPSGRPVTVRYSFSTPRCSGDPACWDQPLPNNRDYTDPGGGMVTIPAGATEGRIRVVAFDDKLDEGLRDGRTEADERFEIVRVNANTGGSSGVGSWCSFGRSRTLHIYDNDDPPLVVTLGLETQLVSRGEDLVFRLTLSTHPVYNLSANVVTLQYRVEPFRINDQRVWTQLENGEDEYPVSDRDGVLIFWPGESELSFTVPTPTDINPTNERRFVDVVLRSDDGSAMFPPETEPDPDQSGSNRKTGGYTWENLLELDDGGATSTPEAPGAAIRFTVSKRERERWRLRYADGARANDGAITGDLHIPYTLSGTARPGVDYEGSGEGTLVFPEDEEISTTFTINLIDDDIREPDETLILTLGSENVRPTSAAPLRYVDGMNRAKTATATVVIPGDRASDPAPTASITPPAAAVSEDAGNRLVFTVTLDGPSGVQEKIAYRLGMDREDDARATLDFRDTNRATRYRLADTGEPCPEGAVQLCYGYGELTFGPTETEKQITLEVLEDDISESTEKVAVQLSRVNVEGSPSIQPPPAAENRVEGIIEDDGDAPPSISIAAPASTVTEGEDLVFTLTLSEANGLNGGITMLCSFDGTATVGEDYSPTGCTSTEIAPGERTATVTLQTTDDTLYERDETVEITLTMPSNPAQRSRVALGTATATATISDAQAAPEVTIAAPTPVGAPEGEALEFPVMLSIESAHPTVAPYILVGAAESGMDYTDPGGGMVTFAAGEIAQTITITTLDDSLDEPDETVEVTLTAPDPLFAVLGMEATASGVINDNDPPEITVDAPASPVVEGAPAEFTLTRTEGDTSEELRVAISVTDASGVLEVSPLPTTATFEAGSATATVSLATDDDEVDEPTATVTLALGTPTAAWTVGMPDQASITVSDNDPPEITVAAMPSTVTEGAPAEFTLTRTEGDISEALTVEISISDPMSVVTGMLPVEANFGAGAATTTVTLATDDDNVDKANAVVTLALDTDPAPTGWTAGAPDMASITVSDNDGAPNPVMSFTASAIDEDGGTAMLTVSTGATTFAADQTIELSFSGVAVLGTDYRAADDSDDSAITTSPYRLTLPARTASASITITAVDDDEDEPNEMITVSATHVENSGVSLGAAQSLFITDDDPPYITVLAPANLVEEGKPVAFVFTRTEGDISEALTVAISITDNSGLLDISPLPTEVVFGKGDATTTISLATEDDNVDEPNPTVTLTLDTASAPTSWTAGRPDAASITIVDNDGATAPTFSFSETSIAEDGGTATLTVSAGATTFASAQTIEISLGGDAMLGTDYTLTVDSDDSAITASPWRLTLPARTASASITITGVNDDEDEPNEDVTVSAVHVDNGNASLGVAQTVSITDDDRSLITVTHVSSPVVEGRPVEFELTRREADISEELIVAILVTDDSGVLAEAGPTEAIFEPGDSTTTVSLATDDDVVDEPDAVVRLSLGTPSLAWKAGMPGEANIIVTDNDLPTLTLSLSPKLIVEDGGRATLTVSAGGATSTADMTIELAFDGVAVLGTDYTAALDSDGSEITAFPYNWILPAGATSASITITAVSDELDEVNETVLLSGVHVENSRAPLLAPQTLTITDDDLPQVTVEVAAEPVTEGEFAEFKLVRTGGEIGVPLTVSFSVSDESGVLTDTPPTEAIFGRNAETILISLATENDNAEEAHAEVTLSLDPGAAPANWRLGDPGAASVTVRDNDVAPAPTLALSQESIAEDGGMATLTVNTGAVTYAADQTFELIFDGGGVDVDSDNVAKFNEDYVVVNDVDNARIPSPTYRLTLPAKASSASVTIMARDDLLSELPEAVTVLAKHIENGGAPVGPTQTLTIVDDEATPNLSISGEPRVLEGGALEFTVGLTGFSGRNIEVQYTVGGTAHAGEDYAALPGEIEFAPGERAKRLVVDTFRDRESEGDETVVITLDTVKPTRAADLPPLEEREKCSGCSATGVILDDVLAQNTAPTEEWLGRFGSMLVTQVLEAVDSRLSTSRLPGIEAKLGGRRVGSAHGADAHAGGSVGGLGAGGATGAISGLGVGDAFGAGFAGVPGASGAAARRQRHPGGDSGAVGALAHPAFEGIAAGPGPVFSAPGSAEDAGHFGRGGASYQEPEGFDARRLLNTSSFTLTQETSREGFASLWTRGAYMSIEGGEGEMDLDGDVMAIQVGADWMSDPWIVGLTAVQSIGEGEYSDVVEGEIETDLTSFHPYIGYRIANRISTWAALGYGLGKLDITPKQGSAVKTNVEFAMSAAGVQGDLLKPDSPGGFHLSLRADAALVQTRSDARAGLLARVRNDTSRVRLSLEGSRRLRLDQGETLTPTVEVAMLQDGGDFESSRGVDLGLGFLYVNTNGFATDLRLRSLLSHENQETGEDTGRDEWAVSGELRYDPAPFSPRGPEFSLDLGYGGRASGGVDELFALKMSQTPSLGPGDALSGGRRLQAELGYGLSALGGRYTGTPWARFGLTDAGPDWRFGWRFTPFGEGAPDLDTGIEYGSRGDGRELRLEVDTRF